MTTVVSPTASQRAAARVLLAAPEKWLHGRSKVDGREFWVIQGSKGTAHWTSSYGCTCKGFAFRGCCSHVVAVVMREAREAAQQPASELPMIRRTRYGDLFPADA